MTNYISIKQILDDLSNIMAFIRNNMKNNLQKQLEGVQDNE